MTRTAELWCARAALAAAVSLLLTLTACSDDGGAPVPCGPQTCSGCCGGGACLPGDSPQSCGTGGGACVECRSGESCMAGVCTTAACGPDTCPEGCCYLGVCLDGTNRGQCGTGGLKCEECADGQACVNQQCQNQACSPSTCEFGCCDSNGNCVQGSDEAACGSGGTACEVCESGQVCTAQRVCKVPDTNCDSTTCPTGCCDSSGNCVEAGAQNASACGTGGGACVSCANTQECQSGQCVCTATSCSSGCCEGDTCRGGAADDACGTGGGDCTSCGSGTTCQSGSCTSTYDCATECSGCCDGNTCVSNGLTNDSNCGKGGAACEDCTKSSETCQSGICLASGACAGCGPGTCCTSTGCVSGDQDTKCGDKGDPCTDCTALSPPMVCDTATKSCAVDPNSTWKIVVETVELKKGYAYDGYSSSPDADPPDPFVEVWAGYSNPITSVMGSVQHVENKWVHTFSEVALTKIKASLLLPDSSTGTPNFALKVLDNDNWLNPDDDIAFCDAIELDSSDFGGDLVTLVGCSGPTSFWPTNKIEKVSFRIQPDP